jgi:hypothetical protein
VPENPARRHTRQVALQDVQVGPDVSGIQGGRPELMKVGPSQPVVRVLILELPLPIRSAIVG